jgi:hypothetical protein
MRHVRVDDQHSMPPPPRSPMSARRREHARALLRDIARAEGVRWLLREAEVIATWSLEESHRCRAWDAATVVLNDSFSHPAQCSTRDADRERPAIRLSAPGLAFEQRGCHSAAHQSRARFP